MNPADILFYGGGAGGGKTWTLLLEPIYHKAVHGFMAVMFRRTMPNITNAGSMWDQSTKLYPHAEAKSNASVHHWTFPSGARVEFASLQHEKSVLDWKSSEIALIGFDQIEEFTEGQFWYMISRNRSTCGVAPYVRCTVNPVPEDDAIGGWVHTLIQWWLDKDTGLPIKERDGIVRWFFRLNEEIRWYDSKQEAVTDAIKHGFPPDKAVILPKSLSFIAARLEDNKKLMEVDPGYYANLMSMPLVERERLYGGNWNIRPTAGKVFNRAWFTIVPTAPIDTQWVRYWDKAGSEDSGAYSAGVKMGYSPTTKGYYVGHVARGQWEALARERVIRQCAEMDGTGVTVYVEQEPGPIWEEEFVQMADGSLKELKHVEVGELVIGKSGGVARVSASLDKGMLETRKIMTDSGRVVHAAFDHPFMTARGWVNASDLIQGDVMAMKAGIEYVPFYEPLKEEGRLAGYFVGDGCCVFGKNGSPVANVVCSDSLQGGDIIHCVEYLGFKVKVGGGLRRDGERWTYNMSGGIREWLKVRKLAGKGTADKNVPDWVMAAPLPVISNFIGAYFACDGSVYWRTAKGISVEFYSTNRRLLEQVSSLLLRFGIHSKLRMRKYNEAFQATRQTQYRLILTRSDDSVGRFAQFIPVYGKKKALLEKYPRRDFDRPYIPDEIVSIEDGGRKPCRCLSVADEESFIVNDLIVHNSGGKESAKNTIINTLPGFACFADRVKGDKYARAHPYAAMVQAYNVFVVAGEWNDAYLSELHNFTPEGSGYKDQVDASSGAYNKLTGGKSLDLLNPVVTPEQEQVLLDEANEAAINHVLRQGVVFPGEW